MTEKVDFKNLYEIAEEQSKAWFELCFRYKKKIEELESQASDKDKEIEALKTAYSEYIKFLEDESNKFVGFAATHGIVVSPEVIKKGDWLRQTIKLLTQ